MSCPYVVGYRVTDIKPANRSTVKRGSSVALEFALRDSANRLITDAIGLSLASGCAVKVETALVTPAIGCAKYDDKSDRFTFDIKTSKTTPVGIASITIRVLSGSVVVTQVVTTVDVR